MISSIACSRCATPVPPEKWNLPDLVRCQGCGSPIAASVFPALSRGIGPASAPGPTVTDGEASCFYHPRNPAWTPCDSCGRFLCSVCEVELSGRRLCPMCLETEKKKGRLTNLENQRILYGHIALALAIYPILVFYLTILTAPAALYMALRYWKAPRSLVGGSHFPHVAAIVIALCEIAGWAAFLVFFIPALRSARPH
jgi:hypothetical protein